MARIEGQTRSDPTDEIILALQEGQEDLSRDGMHLWFEQSQEWLAQAAQNRSELGKQHGNQTREQNGLHAIQQSAVPPSWDENDEYWSFSYPHIGAIFQEFGARPHEIRARRAEVLAFEWPDAPQEVKQQFEDTEGDLVFFESIDHPGVPAIGFVRRGRDITRSRLEKRGGDVEAFERRGEMQ